MLSYLPGCMVAGGIWSVVNGVLHDIFVLRSEHGKQYDRTLLRLLLDGHVLITCGLVQILCYNGLEKGNVYTTWLAMVATVSLLVYCGLIFPFLKSVVTTALNAALLILLILRLVA
jgi:hypothetical protein